MSWQSRHCVKLKNKQTHYIECKQKHSVLYIGAEKQNRMPSVVWPERFGYQWVLGYFSRNNTQSQYLDLFQLRGLDKNIFFTHFASKIQTDILKEMCYHDVNWFSVICLFPLSLKVFHSCWKYVAHVSATSRCIACCVTSDGDEQSSQPIPF